MAVEILRGVGIGRWCSIKWQALGTGPNLLHSWTVIGSATCVRVVQILGILRARNNASKLRQQMVCV